MFVSNGTETFVFKSVPCCGDTGRIDHGRRQRLRWSRRGRWRRNQQHVPSASTANSVAAAPSYATVTVAESTAAASATDTKDVAKAASSEPADAGNAATDAANETTPFPGVLSTVSDGLMNHKS